MIARGTVIAARAGKLEILIPAARVGAGVRVRTAHGELAGTVSAVERDRAIVDVHGALAGVAAGDTIVSDPSVCTLPLGSMLVGQAIDAFGARSIDGARVRGRRGRLASPAPFPSQRAEIDAPFWTGIRAIDALLTIGRGARVGLFGPPGAGKSTMLNALVRGSGADAAVIALIGERGREAEEWMRAAPPHATLVCATGDRSAGERIRAADVALAQANALRSRGLHVLLIFDSLARFANALRENAVASGESTGRGGYPPSVFAALAQFLEGAGCAGSGSVTLVATVLSDGDERDPVSESARSLLDGHFQLSSHHAHAGRFPAIDVPASVSRTMNGVVDPGHARDASIVRRALAALDDTREARKLGIMPSDPFALRAIASEEALEQFLRQGSQAEHPESSLSRLALLADTLR